MLYNRLGGGGRTLLAEPMASCWIVSLSNAQKNRLSNLSHKKKKKNLSGDQTVIHLSDAQAPQVQMTPQSLLMSSSLSWAFCCWERMPRQVWQYICIYGGYVCKSFIVPVSSCSSWLGRAQQDALCGEFISPIGNFQTAICTFRKKKTQKKHPHIPAIFTLVPQLFFTHHHPFEFNRQQPFMP